MKKIIVAVSILVLSFVSNYSVEAKIFPNPMSEAIKKSDISKTALISASFKEVSTAKPVYSLNADKPMTPASIQKIVTLLPTLNTLGKDYEFKTQIYTKGENIYIKLGADPYLTTRDLKSMMKVVSESSKKAPKKIFIDDSILDTDEWGMGWQWDDNLSPSMPKFSAYNLDKNIITLSINPTVQGAPAEISTNVFYPTAFVNNVITSDKNDVKLERKIYVSADVIEATGTVCYDLNVNVPVNYPRRYFILRLEEILRNIKLGYYGEFARQKTPKDSILLVEVKNPVSIAVDDILKNSNNMVSETLFKVAGGKYVHSTGSAGAAIEMLNDYYTNLGINVDNIKIVDASGVSKDNMLNADFITDVLVKTAKTNLCEDLKSHMAAPGEGTLADRMLYFKDNIKAKTGTLADTSTIAGYLTAKSGKVYAFCIMTKDSKSKSADKKAFEEYLLREAFEQF